jgi:hypothetical protein
MLLLSFRDLVKGITLGLHPNMTVVPQHLAGHVAGDLHDGLIAGAALGQFRNQRMP